MTVSLAYVHDKEVTHSFHDSLMSLVLYDLAHEGHLEGTTGPIKMRCGTDGLPGARNKVVQRVLDSGSDWLFWIDSDMGYLPDTMARLVEAADPKERPIVGGLCFAQKEILLDGYGGFITRAGPTIMDWRQDEDGKEGFAAHAWYAPNTLVKCAGTGSACVLIHRSVFENIRKEFGPVWYDKIRDKDGFAVAEDLSFCMRAGVVGAPIYVHTGIKTTHMKTQWVSDTDFWEQATPPPATEQTAVLVPVMKRPEAAEPFMQSLRASTGLATAYVIYDEDDEPTREAWKRAGAKFILSSGPSFATKVNDAYRVTKEPWMFLVGDDVKFWPGWLDHAQYAAELTGAGVVGTNDLCNPAVMKGEHATHLLIRRSYVDEQGASWDGPGTVCHEGYRHWFVDNEIVVAARQRGAWVMALGSRVEHFHPFYKKGKMDETYRIGQLYAERDGKTFEKRFAANSKPRG